MRRKDDGARADIVLIRRGVRIAWIVFNAVGSRRFQWTLHLGAIALAFAFAFALPYLPSARRHAAAEASAAASASAAGDARERAVDDAQGNAPDRASGTAPDEAPDRAVGRAPERALGDASGNVLERASGDARDGASVGVPGDARSDTSGNARNDVRGDTASGATLERILPGIFPGMAATASPVDAFDEASDEAPQATPALSKQDEAAPVLRFAWLRDGGMVDDGGGVSSGAAGGSGNRAGRRHAPGDARLWTFAPSSGVAQGPGARLPDTLQTPLGSVWKLFVYAYLVDRQLPAPDYQCTGRSREEVYCCMSGGHIDRDRALVQSCGLFFDPRRLRLDAAGWRQYWRARNAPAWLQDLDALRPERRVRVRALLDALQAVSARARSDTASTLVSVVTSGRGEGAVPLFGSLLRAKTWTMPDSPHGYAGGAAGWLADGTPVWIGGHGSSARVLADAAPRIAPLVARSVVPDDSACVVVDFFTRYPVRAVRAVSRARAGAVGAGGAGGAKGVDGGANSGADSAGVGADAGGATSRAAPPGPLDGAFSVTFENGNVLPIDSHGELWLERAARGRPHVVGRFGMNDYVARVVAREGDATQPQAARALAVAARSYLVQHAGRARGCYRIDDSSRTQRVLPRAPDAAARRAADFTDSLVLAGVPVQFHHDQAAPGQMSWLAAKAAAQRGQRFNEILARTWPAATLTSFASPLAGDCQPVDAARAWLRREAPRWDARLAGEAGYEWPDLPAVCAVTTGLPYADAGRNRVYIRRLQSDDDRIALAHEYLHLAFAHHPRGQDETFIEQTARTLILTGN